MGVGLVLLLLACSAQRGAPPSGTLVFQRGDAVISMDVATGATLPLATIPGRAFPGPVSPDGRCVVVISEVADPDGAIQSLWLVPLDRSPARDLGVSGHRVKNPAWTPDSRSVVVEWDHRNFSDLYRVELPGGEPTRLTASEGGSFDPAVSPDGNRIVFASSRDGNAELYVQGLEDGSVTRLTHDPGDDTRPAWLTSERLAWIGYRGDRAGLWTMNADGSGAAELSLEGVAAQTPPGASASPVARAGAPAGSVGASVGEVVEFAVAGDRLVATVRSGKLDIRVFDWARGVPDGGVVGPERDDTATLSPDGEWIAFDRGNQQEVWLARRDGSEARKVATGWLPRWVPNTIP